MCVCVFERRDWVLRMVKSKKIESKGNERERLDRLAISVQKQLEVDLTDLQTLITNKVQEIQQTTAKLFENSSGNKEKTVKNKNRKEFIPRDSMLTVMLDEDENYKTIFNLFAVVLFFWALSL